MQNEKLDALLVHRTELQAQLAAVSDQVESIQAENRHAVMAEAQKMLKTVGLRANFTPLHMPTKKQATAGTKVPPKYRHTHTGQAWSGRGKQPTWFAAAQAAGTVETLTPPVQAAGTVETLTPPVQASGAA